MTTAGDWTATLARQRDHLRPASTGSRVADLIRAQVLAGELQPGVQLGEESLVGALGVARNTVREGLQLLAKERLVEHVRHRGVFVRRLSLDDLADLCGLRRVLETGALREAASAGTVPPERVDAVLVAAESGEQARRDDDWAAAGTANAQVHLALAALPGNPRLIEAIGSVLAEMRLAFIVLSDPRAMHEPYVSANTELAHQVAAGRLSEAADELVDYLDRSQKHLVSEYASVVDEGASVADQRAAGRRRNR